MPRQFTLSLPGEYDFFFHLRKAGDWGVPFVSNNPKPTRAEALEYYRRVALSYELRIHLFEEVVAVHKQATTAQHRFSVETSLQTYTADYIIIATGFYDIPYKLNVPGEDLPKVTHYYKDPHFYAFQKVLVVGAQNSAVDAALETWRKGAEVTMVIRGPEIGQRVKYWVRPDIINRINEGSINAYYNSTVREIGKKEVIIDTPDGPVTIANDWVIALTGYQPNLQFLTRLGVRLAPDAIRTPEVDPLTFQTNQEGIYLAGVICGGMNTHRLFIENSRAHAVAIVEHIKQNYYRS